MGLQIYVFRVKSVRLGGVATKLCNLPKSITMAIVYFYFILTGTILCGLYNTSGPKAENPSRNKMNIFCFKGPNTRLRMQLHMYWHCYRDRRPVNLRILQDLPRWNWHFNISVKKGYLPVSKATRLLYIVLTIFFLTFSYKQFPEYK